MQGDDPKYWQAASLLKHFLANSNEKGRSGSSSDFDDRLFYEYYSVPFRMGLVEGGARCFMASYNAWNKIPMTANPIIPNVVIKDWGVDGVICTDAGSLGNMVRAHRYYPDLAHGAAGAIKAGINQFLDQYDAPARDALNQNLLTMADIEKVIKGTFRVFIRLGLLDPPDRNPYAKIGSRAHRPLDHAESQGFRPPGHAGIGRPAEEHRQSPAAGQDHLQIHRRHRPARQRGRSRLVWQHSRLYRHPAGRHQEQGRRGRQGRIRRRQGCCRRRSAGQVLGRGHRLRGQQPERSITAG